MFINSMLLCNVHVLCICAHEHIPQGLAIHHAEKASCSHQYYPCKGRSVEAYFDEMEPSLQVYTGIGWEEGKRDG